MYKGSRDECATYLAAAGEDHKGHYTALAEAAAGRADVAGHKANAGARSALTTLPSAGLLYSIPPRRAACTKVPEVVAAVNEHAAQMRFSQQAAVLAVQFMVEARWLAAAGAPIYKPLRWILRKMPRPQAAFAWTKIRDVLADHELPWAVGLMVGRGLDGAPCGRMQSGLLVARSDFKVQTALADLAAGATCAKSADKIQKFMLVIHAWPNLTDELICARIPDERTLKQFKLVLCPPRKHAPCSACARPAANTPTCAMCRTTWRCCTRILSPTLDTVSLRADRTITWLEKRHCSRVSCTLSER
jgi:hypothetical protein